MFGSQLLNKKTRKFSDGKYWLFYHSPSACLGTAIECCTTKRQSPHKAEHYQCCRRPTVNGSAEARLPTTFVQAILSVCPFTGWNCNFSQLAPMLANHRRPGIECGIGYRRWYDFGTWSILWSLSGGNGDIAPRRLRPVSGQITRKIAKSVDTERWAEFDWFLVNRPRNKCPDHYACCGRNAADQDHPVWSPDRHLFADALAPCPQRADGLALGGDRNFSRFGRQFDWQAPWVLGSAKPRNPSAYL